MSKSSHSFSDTHSKMSFLRSIGISVLLIIVGILTINEYSQFSFNNIPSINNIIIIIFGSGIGILVSVLSHSNFFHGITDNNMINGIVSIIMVILPAAIVFFGPHEPDFIGMAAISAGFTSGICFIVIYVYLDDS